jgi:hypothetical protein
MLSKGDGVERGNNKALNCLQQALELEDLSITFPIELGIQKNYCSLLSVADEDDKIAAHQRLKNLVLQGVIAADMPMLTCANTASEHLKITMKH